MEPRHWWKEAKIYELYVDKFADDFRGLTARLDYFTRLGIDCLHILPHYPSPMADQGYDVSDYRSVRRELGTLDDFKTFVEAAHGRGIRIIADFVLNHVSTQHPWFLDASSSRESPYRDHFLWSETGNEFPRAPNMLPDMKDSNWIENPATADRYFATFYPEQADLNWLNPQVFEDMLSHMCFWAELGVDGFRLDAAPFLMKEEGTTCTNLPSTHAIIKRLRRRLDARFPQDIVLLGEVVVGGDDIVSSIMSYFGEGDECHLMYHFPLMTEFWLALQSGDGAGVERMIERTRDIPPSCQWATFLRSHDEIGLQFISSEETRGTLLSFLDLEGDYLFNKGQATVKRNASILGDPERIMDAFKMLYGSPGSPIMYYGDEIGMKNLPLAEDIVDMRQYVRGAFDWDEAEWQMSDTGSLFSRLATLVRARRSNEHAGDTEAIVLQSERHG